jgi:hypothetical protein
VPAPVSVFAQAAPPAATGNGVAGGHHERTDPWGTAAADERPPARPERPAFAPAAPANGNGTGGAAHQLQRRVPQAHLAPELRRPLHAPAPPPAAAPVLNAAQTRAALSRYQASRAAALSAMDSGAVDPSAPIGPDLRNGE